MTQQRSNRTRRTERAIAALLACPTIRGAAESLGCSPRTLERLLKRPEFQAAYSEAKADMLKAATGKLRAEASTAVDVLAMVAGDARAPASSRVTAARTLLELAFRSHETENLEERIAALEGIAEHGKR